MCERAARRVLVFVAFLNALLVVLRLFISCNRWHFILEYVVESVPLKPLPPGFSEQLWPEINYHCGHWLVQPRCAICYLALSHRLHLWCNRSSNAIIFHRWISTFFSTNMQSAFRLVSNIAEVKGIYFEKCDLQLLYAFFFWSLANLGLYFKKGKIVTSLIPDQTFFSPVFFIPRNKSSNLN